MADFTMTKTFMELSNSTAIPQSHLSTPEGQNLSHRTLHWETVNGNRNTTTEPISPAIPDCTFRYEKSFRGTTCAFAPEMSPQPSRWSGNQRMPLIETSMPANNSKRTHADVDSPDSNPEVNADGQHIVWTIEYGRKPVASTSKRARKRQCPDNEQIHQSPFQGKDQKKGALDLRYTVKPITWLEMQNIEYNVGDVSYKKNDYVYVRSDDDINFWVAHILETRETSTSRVYALVAWMYWPDELPDAHMGTEKNMSGRRWYHGTRELVASNHLDVLDVNSMAGHAPVAQCFEDDDDTIQDGLYWRQTFNISSGVLSVCIYLYKQRNRVLN
ncbi:hypothetical protein ACLOAV_008319 [Pseudogymnoascus australis]